MATQNARKDRNQFTTTTYVAGTSGTAAVGTEDVVQGRADSSTGAQYVYNLGPAGTFVNIVTGTQQTLGTVGSVLGIGGTVQVSGASAGTNVNIVTGSQQTLGTVGSVLGIGGTVQVSGASAGTNVNVVTGTITTGSLSNVAMLNAGTIDTVTSVSNVVKGTITKVEGGTIGALAIGTIATGTVTVTSGTVVGPVASGGSETGAPVPIGGTDIGGTVRSPLVNSSGFLTSNVNTGTINVGTVTVTNPTGTVVEVNKGTINLGSITGNVGVSTGTINVGTVTLTNPTGTVVEINKGTINLGTVAISNTPTVNMASGTLNVGTTTVSGNVGVSTGTITTGSLTNLATLHNGTVVMPSGTVTSVTNIVGGTIGSVLGIGGTVQVSGASAGTFVNIVTGTQQTLGTVGVVNNLTNGSINLLTGTLTRVSNIGTLESGTVQISSLPVVLGTSYGTLGTTGALVWGTLVSASGAGTRQYVSGLSITVMSGTVDVAITNVGTIASPQSGNGVLARGNFRSGGGMVRDFNPIQASGTNVTLAYFLGGVGTAYFIVNYWQGV